MRLMSKCWKNMSYQNTNASPKLKSTCNIRMEEFYSYIEKTLQKRQSRGKNYNSTKKNYKTIYVQLYSTCYTIVILMASNMGTSATSIQHHNHSEA